MLFCLFVLCDIYFFLLYYCHLYNSDSYRYMYILRNLFLYASPNICPLSLYTHIYIHYKYFNFFLNVPLNEYTFWRWKRKDLHIENKYTIYFLYIYRYIPTNKISTITTTEKNDVDNNNSNLHACKHAWKSAITHIHNMLYLQTYNTAL